MGLSNEGRHIWKGTELEKFELWIDDGKMRNGRHERREDTRKGG